MDCSSVWISCLSHGARGQLSRLFHVPHTVGTGGHSTGREGALLQTAPLCSFKTQEGQGAANTFKFLTKQPSRSPRLTTTAMISTTNQGSSGPLPGTCQAEQVRETESPHPEETKSDHNQSVNLTVLAPAPQEDSLGPSPKAADTITHSLTDSHFLHSSCFKQESSEREATYSVFTEPPPGLLPSHAGCTGMPGESGKGS